MKFLQKIILFFLLTNCQSYNHLDEYNSLVLISSYHQHLDHHNPWKKHDISNQMSMGVVVKIKGNKLAILTTAEVSKNIKKIELQNIGESQKHGGKIKFIDYEINLALIEPIDQSFLTEKKPVELAKEINLGKSFTLYQQKTHKSVIKATSKLSSVNFSQVTNSSYGHLYYLSKTTSTANKSIPVFYKKKLAGLTSHKVAKQTYIIPSHIIKHFLQDDLDSNYKGFPSIGIKLNPLISPKTRLALNVPDNINGVQLSKVLPYSSFSELQKEDVLIKINDREIDETGLVTHKLWGKIHFAHYINKLYSEDEISLTILRNGEEFSFTKKINRHSSNFGKINFHTTSDEVPYLIQGGFIFQELSLDYLKSWGYRWASSSPAYLYYLLQKENFTIPLTDKFIIISQIIPDEYNKGYEHLKNSVVDSINQTKITTLKDVEKKFSQSIEKLIINTKFHRGEIILGTKNLDKVNQRISRNYNIPLKM
jgi:hypothetical protein